MPRRICPLVLISISAGIAGKAVCSVSRALTDERIKSEAEYVSLTTHVLLGLLLMVRGSERSVQCSGELSS